MVAFFARRLLLASVVLGCVSFGTFALIATRFSSTCTSEYTPVGEAYPPLAGTVGQATTLYWRWVRGIPSGGSFGEVCNGQTTAQIGPAFLHTAALLTATAVLVVVFALAVGTLAATRAGTALDTTLRGLSYAAWGIPPFVLALLLQQLVIHANSSGVHWFAANGWLGTCWSLPGSFLHRCEPTGHGLSRIVELVRHLTVPAISLSVAFIGTHSRYLRSSLLVALQAPYTTTARAKGLPERRVVVLHALRNSLATFISALLLDFGAIFGAAMAVDAIFNLGGLGSLLLTEIAGIGAGDGPRFLNAYAIESLLAVTAAMVIAASMLAEIAVAALDPRVKLR